MSAPRFVYIEGKDGLIRDTRSFGIINTNTRGLQEAKRRKEDALRKLAESQREKREFREMQEKVNQLTNDVSEIKILLRTLIAK